MSLAYFLSPTSGVLSEGTVALLDEGRIWLCVPAAAEVLMHDWLTARLPGNGSVTLAALTESHTTLVISGPRAPRLMADVAPRHDWSAAGMPWLTTRPAHVGFVAAQVLAVSYSGETSFELHLPAAQVNAAFEAVWSAGARLGLAPFGARAADSMRIEKGYRGWKTDLVTEADPFESALDRFVDLSKDFEGRAALRARRRAGPARLAVALRLATDRAPALGGGAILDTEGRVVGSVTSGAYGHRIRENRALGYVAPCCAGVDTELAVEVMGDPVPATVRPLCAYDPASARLRGLPVRAAV